MPIAAVFVSGWEYNRLLSSDPFEPKNSALPSQILWDGSSQFWLFEKVYCTNEALDNEIAAYEQLGWTTGLIFDDLRRRGFLEPIDFRGLAAGNALLNTRTKDAHAQLRSRYGEDLIMRLLQKGDDATLEGIKCELLTPLFDHLRCAKNISPNSIRNWINTVASREAEKSPEDTLARLIAEPIVRQIEPWRIGSPLCNPPGTGLAKEAMQLQQETEKRIQTPMIPDLLAGKLSSQDYYMALTPAADVYKPVNEQLLNDYYRGINRLQRIRDAAKRELWPSLHGEWLPRLEEDPSFIEEFKHRLRFALFSSRFESLETIVNLGIVAIASVGALSAGTLSSLFGAGAESSTIAGVTGAAIGTILGGAHKKKAEDARSLIAFYEKLKK